MIDCRAAAITVRGTLRGRTALDKAVSGSPELACASIMAVQGKCLGRKNRPALHGREKVYSSIPERASQLKQVFVY
jgi:hypothetical protein